jgi:hypothetical protein
MTSVSTTSGQQCPVSQGGADGWRPPPPFHCAESTLLMRRLPDRLGALLAPSCELMSLFARELQPQLLLRRRPGGVSGAGAEI